MVVTIDHTAYPTIIDGILQHANMTTRLAFSATSKAYRDKLCPVLGHVALHRNTRTNRMGFTSPDGMSPARYDHSAVIVLDLTASTWNTLVLAPYDEGWVDEESREVFPQLAMLRRPPPSPTAPIDDHINKIYVSGRLYPQVDFVDLDAIPRWWYDDAGTPVLPMYNPVRRYALHLRWDDTDTDTPFPLLEIRPGTLPYSRVILWPQHRGVGPPTPQRAARFLPALLNSLFRPYQVAGLLILVPPAYRTVPYEHGWPYHTVDESHTLIDGWEGDWVGLIDSPGCVSWL